MSEQINGSGPVVEFVAFQKIPRLRRNIVISEKIDGTNAVVHIADDGETVTAGSRSRWITPEDDNYGFARWAAENVAELRRLGPGFHYGEWWGAGIQRRYGLTEKRFSLFNSARWKDEETRPKCCHVAPVLYVGPNEQLAIDAALTTLRVTGSVAAPGFMDPEGIVVYHTAGGELYKVTLKGDEAPKGAAVPR